jgi:hypothetical protein
MKVSILIFSFLCMVVFSIAQTNNARILKTAEINKIFDDSFKNNNNVLYPIVRVYEYAENDRRCFVTLTESIDEVKGKDSISKNVKAFIFKELQNGLSKTVEISDNIIPTLNEEYNISFWTKYFSIEKVGSSLVPIIVYGTKGMNNYMDGRIKIIVCYNNQKIVIRHQNAVLDGERLTKIDKAFYTLPATIQNAVKKKITAMEKADHAILGYGWEKDMKLKKLEIKG